MALVTLVAVARPVPVDAGAPPQNSGAGRNGGVDVCLRRAGWTAHARIRTDARLPESFTRCSSAEITMEFPPELKYTFVVDFAEGSEPTPELILAVHAAVVHALEQEMVFGKLKPLGARVRHWILSADTGACYYCGRAPLQLLDGLCEQCWQIPSAREGAPPSVVIGA